MQLKITSMGLQLYITRCRNDAASRPYREVRGPGGASSGAHWSPMSLGQIQVTGTDLASEFTDQSTETSYSSRSTTSAQSPKKKCWKNR